MDVAPHDGMEADGIAQAIIRNLPGMAMIAFDRQLRFTHAGGAALAEHGWAADALVGRHMRDALPKEMVDRLAPAYTQALDGHESCFEYRSMDGTRLYSVRISPMIEAGEVRGGIVVARDITEARDAMDALHASEARFRTLAAFAPVGITIVDAAGRLEYANARFCELIGMTPAAARGDGWRGAVDPADRALVDRRLDEPGDLTIDFRVRDDGGRMRWLQAFATPLGDTQTRIFVVIETTQQLQANARFRQLLELVPDAIVGVASDGRVVMANHQADILFGFDAGELVGTPVEHLIPESLRALHVAHRAAFHRAPRTRTMAPDLQLRALRRDGSDFPCEISLTPIDMPDATVAVAAIRDISDRIRVAELTRRQEERQRRGLEEMLRIQDEERSKIAADLHDDTVQVMAASLIALSAAEERLRRSGDDDNLRAVTRARETLGVAIDRTRSMMFDLRPQLLEAEGLGAAIESAAASAAAESGFAVDLDVSIPRQSPVVESLAYRTLLEAIANVRKHAQAQHVRIRMRQPDGRLEGEVADDGIGFDVSAELDQARRTFHMGLDIAMERIRLAGGSMQVTSSPGGGTSVTFQIPVPPTCEPAVGETA